MPRTEASNRPPAEERSPPPARGIRCRVAAVALWLGRWTAVGGPPPLPKFVVVAAPHTAWMDGFWMLAFAWRWGMSIDFLVKRSATRGPLGWIVPRVGGIAVDRSSPQGLVGELAREFGKRDRLVLSVPPEGTRARGEYWRSGFYWIAKEANVPVCLSYLDYGRRRGGFGPCVVPSDSSSSTSIRADMDRVRAFYRDVRGKYPERFTPPRLREESEKSEA